MDWIISPKSTFWYIVCRSNLQERLAILETGQNHSTPWRNLFVLNAERKPSGPGATLLPSIDQ